MRSRDRLRDGPDSGRFPVSRLLASCLLSSALLCGCLTSAHDRTAPATHSPGALTEVDPARHDPDARALLRECSTIAARLRQLSFHRRILPRLEGQQALEASVARNVDLDLPPARLEAQTLELEAFGLIPPGFALKPFLTALYAEQTAGYYDPATRSMVLVHKGDGPLNGEGAGTERGARPATEHGRDPGAGPESGARPATERDREPWALADSGTGSGNSPDPGPVADTGEPQDPARVPPAPYQSALAALRARGVTQEKIFLVHELVHALQDQRLGGLKAMLEPPDLPLSTDEREARRALVEGDASFVMTQYMLGESVDLAARTHLADQALAAVESGLFPGTRVLAGGPRVFRERLLFSYLYGMDLVGRLQREGGWPVVNRAWRWPPRSTEQVLHPARYLAGELPRTVRMEAVPGLEAAGYLPVTQGTLGELGVRIWLEEGLDRPDAERAAEGWGGDRYRIYRRAGHRPLAVWMTAWDSPGEAQEFARALEALLQRWPSRPPLMHWEVKEDRVGLILGDEAGLEVLLPSILRAASVTDAQSVPPPVLETGAR